MDKNTILVVDDTPLQAIMLRRVLDQAQYEVTTAKHGLEALGFLKKQKFDLIITDINMPQMDGFELCRAIKKDVSLSDIPIIICTMLSNPEDLIQGIEVGADNYITRPWNDEKLLALVHSLLKGARPKKTAETEEVEFNGKKYKINTSRQYILNFLLSTYEHIHQQNVELTKLKEEIQKANRLLKEAEKEQQKIIHNVFPENVAEELIAYSSVEPTRHENVTVGFIDIIGFTDSAATLDPRLLVDALEYYFDNFDRIVQSHNLERIKTMGDGYFFAGGLSNSKDDHAFHSVLAAIEIRQFIQDSAPLMKQKYGVEWNARFGINMGPVVTGVIGKKRLAYDLWGDTVNLANRLEVQASVNQILISAATYEKIKDSFECSLKGKLAIKGHEGKKELDMDTYSVEQQKEKK